MRSDATGTGWTYPFLSFGFRPFFLAAGLSAPLLMLPWLAFLGGYAPPLGAGDLLQWHVHEMVFGFAGAALAGFLLTAVSNWTGRPPVRGVLLGALLLSWLAGRVAMSGVTGLPMAVVGAIDIVFPLFLVTLAAREILQGGNRRNLPLLLIIGLLALCNLAFHISPGPVSLNLALHLLLLLVVIIGGRVIPAFTGNWLRARGVAAAPSAVAGIDAVVIAGGAFLAAADAFMPASVFAGLLALALSVAHLYRLAGWRGWLTWRDPLVVILHVGYAWLVVGYVLLGVAVFVGEVPRSAGLHALAAGGIGTMILAIMTRAALGHTGRSLRAPPAAVLAYVLVGVGALLRVLAALQPATTWLVGVGGVLWASGFLVFAVAYFPILVGPRVEARGRPDQATAGK